MSLLGRLLPSVMPDERVRVQHAAFALACVAAAAILARAAGTALLLDAFDARLMPWMYAGTAGIVILASFGLSLLMHRCRPDRVVVGVSVAMIVACVIVRLGIGHGGAFAAAAYVLADGIARILVALFWGLAVLLFNPREARRVLGLLGAAGTLACFAAAAWIPALTVAFGARNLLVPVAFLIAGFAATVMALMRREPAVAAKFRIARPEASVLTATGSNTALIRSPPLRNLALLVAVGTFALYLNDFAFIRAVRHVHSGDDLASFLGYFYAIASVLAFAVQLLVLPVLLRKGGVLAALVVLPAALLVVATGVALTGAYPLVLTAKLMEPVLLFSVDAAAVHLLYQGLRKPSRFRARALVDGVGRPVAIALAALFLLVGASTLGAQALAAWVMVACAAWLVLARRAAESYVRGLVDLLGARGLDLSDDTDAHCDPALAAHLRDRLQSAPDSELSYILALVADAPGDWSTAHAALLDRATPALRIAGLEYLARHANPLHAAAVEACLRDEVPAVRVSAIRAHAALMTEAAAERLEPLLVDSDLDVRASAAAVLAKMARGQAAVASEGILRAMLREADPVRRLAAVRALGDTHRDAFADELRALLADEVPEIRLVTLRTLAGRGVPGLSRAMVPLLAHVETASAAGDALVAAGAEALRPLEEAARSHATPPDLKERLPAVLARLGPGALPAIEALMETRGDGRDRDVNRQAIRACCAVLRGWPASAASRHAAEHAARRESDRALSLQWRIEQVQQLPGADFLAVVLTEERDAHLDDCLLLVGAWHPGLDVAALRRHVLSGTGDERAEAIELLDNILGAALRTSLLLLLDGKNAVRGARDAKDHLVLHDLAREPGSEWIVAAAVHACGKAGSARCLDVAEGCLTHASPRVRETALHSLARLADPASVRHHARALLEDEDAAVRRVAMQLAGSTSTK